MYIWSSVTIVFLWAGLTLTLPEVWLGRSSPSYRRSVSGPSPAVRSCKTKEKAAVETGNPLFVLFTEYKNCHAFVPLSVRLGTSLDMLFSRLR